MYMNEPGRSEDDRTRLAVRLAVLTGLAAIVFVVVFFRLWYVQVLAGDDYLQQANDNRIREYRVQPPRGEIVDREGRVLVSNRPRAELRLIPQELPAPGPRLAEELGRLSAVVGTPKRQLTRKLARARAEGAGSPVVLSRDLGFERVLYLRENRASFPGVEVERVFVRDYRRGTLAAHLFGNVGEVTEEQLRIPRYRGLRQGDAVGQSGVEYEYDRFLRGRPGATRVQVDSLGRTRGSLAERPAESGKNVRLTIDSDLQATGEAALSSFGLPGAFVALDPRSGDILALGSQPTFDPSIFTRPISESQYKALTSRKNDAPLANRAIQGLYPTASTHKLITATAGLEAGLIEPTTIVQDTGKVKVDTVTFRNAGNKVHGPIDLVDALRVSSDVYFYKLGLAANGEGDGGPIQDWARRFGLGEATGVDLPAEVDGLIPTPQWRNQLFSEGLTDRPWTLGDNVNFSIGQGDLQATPLQLAVAYSALANGGSLVRPHIVKSIESVTGAAIEEIRPPARRRIDISERTRETIMEGLREAAMKPDGTSYKVFGNWPFDIAGKTGTAERGLDRADQSWFAAVAPYEDPEIVVVVTVERGGFGADTAAPIAARMLETYFGIDQVPQAAAAAGTLDE